MGDCKKVCSPFLNQGADLLQWHNGILPALQTNHFPSHPGLGVSRERQGGGSTGLLRIISSTGWGSCRTLWPGQCPVSCQMAQGFCTSSSVSSTGPPEPGGPGQSRPSTNTSHTKAALGEGNFIPWNVLPSHLLGIVGLTEEKKKSSYKALTSKCTDI